MSAPLFGPIRRSVYHGWTPQTNDTRNHFIKHLLGSVPQQEDSAHLSSVAQFDKDVSDDQKKRFDDALRQVKKYYVKWADPKAIVRDWKQFLYLLDGIVGAAPRFYLAEIRGVTIGEPIGVPLYLIFDLISNTSAAYSLLIDPSFNVALKKLLDSWGQWLRTPESSGTLANEWFSRQGLEALEAGLGKYTFDETFEIEVPPPQRYKSWDSFFTRGFNPNTPGLRPIVKDPHSLFLYNACESTVLRTATNVHLNDTFWLKTQNYSLYDILGGDDKNSLARFGDRLEGGLVYQAFLSPADYHRWHSPVEGHVESHVFGGTYYAVLPDDGAPPSDPDLEPGDPHGALIRSQPWLSAISARAVFIIQPRDDASPVELVAFVAIGMAEVSTCEITYNKRNIPDPNYVKIGDELGTFHFGGSSHLLVVKPKKHYELVFQDFYNSPIRPGQHRWINSVIGQFWKK